MAERVHLVRRTLNFCVENVHCAIWCIISQGDWKKVKLGFKG